MAACAAQSPLGPWRSRRVGCRHLRQRQRAVPPGWRPSLGLLRNARRIARQVRAAGRRGRRPGGSAVHAGHPDRIRRTGWRHRCAGGAASGAPAGRRDVA
ncbi:hypothetical protein E0E05_05365 [Roseitalea porphyridii]|uniref:Uncharacterized protein n=1 Tax=Roseitalea porphyridii TaxID=1852022 RepID=A0A4P6UY77_9HYPH|nr:hypothetical protein E0E05_05365 [Roseitalea porphyridii]